MCPCWYRRTDRCCAPVEQEAAQDVNGPPPGQASYLRKRGGPPRSLVWNFGDYQNPKTDAEVLKLAVLLEQPAGPSSCSRKAETPQFQTAFRMLPPSWLVISCIFGTPGNRSPQHCSTLGNKAKEVRLGSSAAGEDPIVI